jgi:hypothetical protein
MRNIILLSSINGVVSLLCVDQAGVFTPEQLPHYSPVCGVRGVYGAVPSALGAAPGLGTWEKHASPTP